jgi:hypothetical protein
MRLLGLGASILLMIAIISDRARGAEEVRWCQELLLQKRSLGFLLI